MVVYTVCIRNVMEDDFTPWVSSFLTRDAAERFQFKAEEMLKGYGAENDWTVTIDSGELDAECYLDWLRDWYENQEEKDNGD